MKTIKFLILALSLFVGTNLSANECYDMPTECFDIPTKCFEMKIDPIEKPPIGFVGYKITVTINYGMSPNQAFVITDGVHQFFKVNTDKTFYWYYPIANETYFQTITCGTYGDTGCRQEDSCIVIVDGCC